MGVHVARGAALRPDRIDEKRLGLAEWLVVSLRSLRFGHYIVESVWTGLTLINKIPSLLLESNHPGVVSNCNISPVKTEVHE
jgi:hypothetical protein